MTLLRPLLLGAAALVSTVNASNNLCPRRAEKLKLDDAPPAEGFHWGSCGSDAPSSRECSTFMVPLDWADHSGGKAILAVARYNATKEPKLGTLFINPGGPGVSNAFSI